MYTTFVGVVLFLSASVCTFLGPPSGVIEEDKPLIKPTVVDVDVDVNVELLVFKLVFNNNLKHFRHG